LLFEAAGHDEDDPVTWDTWEIAATLGQFCEQTDKPWTRSKYNRFKREQSRRYPSVSTIRNQYGGWDTALKNLAAIGVIPSKPDDPGQKHRAVRRDWTDSDLERALERALEGHDGSLLRMTDYEAWRKNQSEPYPAANTISQRLSGWHDAVEAAGGTTGPTDVYTREECERYLRQALDEQSDQVLSIDDYTTWCETQDDNYPSDTTIKRTFGSWRAAVEAVGGKHGTRGRNKEYSKGEAIAALEHALDAQEDNTLTANAYYEWRQGIDRSEPSKGAVMNYFESWIDAVEAAGGRAGSKKPVRDDEILAVFRESDEHFLTADEVAAELSMGSSMYNRLRNLAESGELNRKDIGGGGTAWWLPESL